MIGKNKNYKKNLLWNLKKCLEKLNKTNSVSKNTVITEKKKT